ncbi:MAG: hypothetical protein V7776_08735 [Halopseudomonas aestusnigri]
MLHTRNKFETLARHHRNETTKKLLASLSSLIKAIVGGKLFKKPSNFRC